MTPQQTLTRSEIDPKYTWNASSVFASDEAWEAEYADIARALPEAAKYRGRLSDAPTTVMDAFEFIEGLTGRLGKLHVFASLSQAVDTSSQPANQRLHKAQGLYGQLLAAVSFLNPELLAVGRETLDAWVHREPRLAVYAHYFDDLFRKQAQVRSVEVEEVLGLAADPFAGSYNTFSVLTNADMQFAAATGSDGQPVPVTQGNIVAILHSADREARRTAWESYADAHLVLKNTLASNLSTSIRQNVFLTRARCYQSSLEMALFRDNLPVAVFDNLLGTFRKNLSIWHRYWAIRRRALGVEKLHPYDIWAPLTDNPPRVGYEQAVDWVCQGLAPLGDEYVRVMRRGCLQDRWIDVFPTLGKSSGAFSSGRQGTHPFIIMNFAEDAISLGTLSHELGHSMHSYLAWQTQPQVYSEYSIFIAEVASNFHQAMLRGYLLKQDLDRNLQIALIEEAMSNFHRYFLVMPTLARFEQELHRQVERGEGLTADGMIELLAGLMAEGFGDEMHLDRPRVGIQWAMFPHLFEDYYVFQYATGISGAHALANRILSGVPGAAEQYLSFLKAGGSLYPLDALKLAGVDLSSPEPVEETFGVLSGLMDRLEELVLG